MFYNRKQAALLLARELEKYKGENVIVLGIPRGGIETAYYLARELNAKLSTLIVHKLGYPGDPEFAFGAMAEDGTVYYNPYHKINLSQEMIDNIEEDQQREIEHRKRIFRESQVFPDIKDKTVIIVDDGVATGATIFAATRMCKKRGAAKIVVAAPVCSQRTENDLLHEADEVVMLEKPEHFSAVSQAYESFQNLSDQEALEFLEKWEKKTI
ncbi:phosphoribosyltransferase [Niastella vici]|uniref:Phosphoribosyltransferase n=1 Tax=Niastella vici TaxID=1703345 RepID=A0A1V9FZR4_9BACT|nr:phosphoribosyltransferase family protein [Niastella vici]OQP63820.1 phosphoribosyltransferase [Niastella vici]